MPPRALDSALLAGFLRALTFAGLTEAIFYRLLPDPSPGRWPEFIRSAHISLNRVGRLTFILAFFLVALSLIHVAYRTLRWKIWPEGLNGFLSSSLFCLAALGFSTVIGERGPLFALAFTVLSLLILLLVAMHAFSSAPSGWLKAFAVCYSAVAISSAAGTMGRLAGSLDQTVVSRALLERVQSYSTGALSAGRVLLAVAGVTAFLAFSDAWDDHSHRKEHLFRAIALGVLAGGGYAAGCLLVPGVLAPQGAGSDPLGVAILAWSLFLGVVTVSINQSEPGRRSRSYGLLMLVLAGFPVRIAYQHLLAVLGAILVFAPAPAPEPVVAPPAEVPTELPA